MSRWTRIEAYRPDLAPPPVVRVSSSAFWTIVAAHLAAEARMKRERGER